jgi:hypothetical protein
MKKLNEILDVQLLNKVLKVVLIILAIFIIFTGGVMAGFHKANYGRNWSEHYRDNFGMGGPRGGGDLFNKGIPMMGYFPNAHGAIGKIIKIELPSIIVSDKENIEKVILIKDTTEIQKMREELKNTDLKLDDFIVVIGSPNEQGQIEAKLIRVMPDPEFIK